MHGGPGEPAVDGAAEYAVRELRESPRRPGRYVVTLSDGQEFVVGVETLADVGATRVGAVLVAATVARLALEGRITLLTDRALSSLSRGRKTRRELMIRLRRVESDNAVVTAALDRLETRGVLSDADVARAEASSRLRRHESPLRVRRALQQKGVARTTADRAVRVAMEDNVYDEAMSCTAVAMKRARTLTSVPADVRRRRLIGFLQRRGFSSTLIRAALAAVTNTAEP